MSRPLRWLLLLPLCAASACALLNGGGSQDEMLRAIRQFNNDVRWGRLDQAGPAVAPAVRAHYMDRMTQIGEQIQILDAELLNISLRDKGDKADALVSISWMETASTIVKHTTAVQAWERKGSNWLLQREERLRGAPLFFIDEPRPKKPPAKKPEGKADDPGASTTPALWEDPPAPEFVTSMSQCPEGSGGGFCDVRIAEGPAPPAHPCQYPGKGFCSRTIVGRCLFQWPPDGGPCHDNHGTCQKHQCVPAVSERNGGGPP